MWGTKIFFLMVGIIVGCYSNLMYVSAEQTSDSKQIQINESDSNYRQNGDLEKQGSETNKKNDSQINIYTDIILPVVMEAIGACLGILGAVYLSGCDIRKKRRVLDCNLQNELIEIKKELEKHINASGTDYYRYATPIWDLIIKSGTLDSLDYTKYERYINIYSKIQYAQEVEREWTHSMLLPDKTNFNKIYTEIMNNERLNIAEEINQAIKLLLGGE